LQVFSKYSYASHKTIINDFSFQEVQEFSAIQASLRILPSMIVAVILNFTTGYVVDRAPVFWLLLVTTILTAGAPLLMALIHPEWSYWRGAFFAQLLVPLGGDVLFTIGLIVVSEVFPEKDQALAGAVYNTVAYFGLSLGLNIMQVVSLLVTEGTQYRDKSSPAALLQGYQASFWTMFAFTMACAVICVLGLRNIGKIGLKRE
jgi:MFS family permease